MNGISMVVLGINLVSIKSEHQFFSFCGNNDQFINQSIRDAMRITTRSTVMRNDLSLYLLIRVNRFWKQGWQQRYYHGQPTEMNGYLLKNKGKRR